MNFICVTQRLIHDKKTNTYKDALDKELVNFLSKLNFGIIPIPNLNINKKTTEKIIFRYVKKFKVKGFVLSGGEDFGVNKNRDKLEKFLIQFCTKNKFPLIGICRGLQMIAKFNKIKLAKVSNHVAKRHLIENIKDKKKRTVNSFHNWKIIDCPKDYKITHVSYDNLIEGIKHKYLPIIGFMWHPEREKKYHKDDIYQFKKLFRF